LGLEPVSSGVRTEDEGLYLVQHGYWKKEMRKAVEAEATEAADATALQGV
jgi:benzoate/toluate 1,2-dioxygenase alpha subunit